MRADESLSPQTPLPSLAELQLVPVLAAALTARQGLLLCSGPVGAGKSTTLAALCVGLAEGPPRHVVAIAGEETDGPLGRTTATLLRCTEGAGAAEQLRLALRLDPDVLVLDPLPPALFPTLLGHAESGLLILGSLTTSSMAQAVASLAEHLADGDLSRAAARERIGRTLVAGVSLRSCRPATPGAVPVLASEVALAGPGLCAALGEGGAAALSGYIATGRHLGMHTLSESLTDLLSTGKISEAEAWARASDKRRFRHPLLP